MTIARLDEEMDPDEFRRWQQYEALYDLPDGYRVAGQLGALISRIMGGKATATDFAPYYKAEGRPAAPGAANHAAAAASKAFVQSVVKRRK